MISLPSSQLPPQDVLENVGQISAGVVSVLVGTSAPAVIEAADCWGIYLVQVGQAVRHPPTAGSATVAGDPPNAHPESNHYDEIQPLVASASLASLSICEYCYTSTSAQELQHWGAWLCVYAWVNQ